MKSKHISTNSVTFRKEANASYSEQIYVCQPAKTGDVTMMKTLKANSVPCVMAAHNPEIVKEALKQQKIVRVTTAIREPIAMDLSWLFHVLSAGYVFYPIAQITSEDIYQYWKTSNSDQLFKKSFYNCKRIIPTLTRYYDEFSKYVVDVKKHEFDQNQGFTIVKNGNIEVFMYQLEKLNELVPELSNWLGVPFDALENGNVASESWIADYYAKAKEEITFSQEYFDACYKDPYVQHCYSKEDIEKFKDKWSGHIQ